MSGRRALVALDGTGAIRALVGGREYCESQFNRAADAKRQPGSAFKPFVYLAALEAGRTPETVREDAPVSIGKWTPENYDQKYRGPVTLQTALARFAQHHRGSTCHGSRAENRGRNRAAAGHQV